MFARALTEALGWDLMKDKTISIRADLDNNRQVTLNEAFLYARKLLYVLPDPRHRHARPPGCPGLARRRYLRRGRITLKFIRFS